MNRDQFDKRLFALDAKHKYGTFPHNVVAVSKTPESFLTRNIPHLN